VTVSEQGRRRLQPDPVARIDHLLAEIGYTLTARLIDGKWVPRIRGLLTYDDDGPHPLNDDALDEIIFGLFRVTGKWPNREMVRVVVRGLAILNAEEEDSLDAQ
jgi:hypothetical protein